MNDKKPNHYHLPSINDLKNHNAAIFYDCDGVLTDNRVLVTETGVESVFFNRSDGLAISQFRNLGVHQAIISTETNPVVARRAEKLHIPVIHKLDTDPVQRDKGEVLRSYCTENNISLEYSIFIGNDINDLPALKLVGYPCCPADAEEEVKTFITERLRKDGKAWISTRTGGCGVIRELMRELESSATSSLMTLTIPHPKR